MPSERVTIETMQHASAHITDTYDGRMNAAYEGERIGWGRVRSREGDEEWTWYVLLERQDSSPLFCFPNMEPYTYLSRSVFVSEARFKEWVAMYADATVFRDQ